MRWRRAHDLETWGPKRGRQKDEVSNVIRNCQAFTRLCGSLQLTVFEVSDPKLAHLT